MDIQVKATGIEHTPAIDAYAEEKIGSLEKFLQRVNTPHTVVIELSKTSNHHKNGPVFSCHAHLTVPHETMHAEAEAADLYAAIDEVHDDLQRQIIKYKEIRAS